MYYVIFLPNQPQNNLSIVIGKEFSVGCSVAKPVCCADELSAKLRKQFETKHQEAHARIILSSEAIQRVDVKFAQS